VKKFIVPYFIIWMLTHDIFWRWIFKSIKAHMRWCQIFHEITFLVINGNHVKVLVNIISMVALVTRMNIQRSKYMVLGWKHTMVTPFGVSHCTILQGCACSNVSYFKFWNIFTIFLLIILEYNLGKILEKKLFHFTL